MSTPPVRILVLGLGGAGISAIETMISNRLSDVRLVVADTNPKDLAHSQSDWHIRLGPHRTEDFGSRVNPEIGRVAAEESSHELLQHLAGADIVCIVAGMGGSTGTGAAPIIARMARERGMLTVGVVTKPFIFEGAWRTKTADAGIAALQQYVDTLIVIPNQNLFRLANERIGWKEAFKMVDNVLYMGVRGVTDLMVAPGLVNLDVADIRTVMTQAGKAVMGIGEAEGENRAIRAAEAAISDPLLDGASMSGAHGLLINITGGEDISLFEVDQAANRIREEVAEDANIIFGSAVDDALTGKVRVSVVATGTALYEPVQEGSRAGVQAPTEPLPQQGAGPHFGLSATNQITTAGALDSQLDGDDLRRIDQLLPLVRECAEDFASTSSSLQNQHPTLIRDVSRYGQAISAPVREIDWGLVWGLGVRLEAATAAAERKITDRIAPELNDEALSALQALRNLHVPLILATRDGRELQEQADRMLMTKMEQKAFGQAAIELSEKLRQHSEIIEPDAAAIITEAAETVGAEPHPERGTTYGFSAVKNVSIVLCGAALAAMPKFLGGKFFGDGAGNFIGEGMTIGMWEIVKKLPAFAKATDTIGSDLPGIAAGLMPFRSFIIENKTHLRAVVTGTSQLKWLLGYIDYITQSSPHAADRTRRPSDS